jgi:ferredoxin
LVWYDARCIGVEKCVKICPKGALVLTEKGIVMLTEDVMIKLAEAAKAEGIEFTHWSGLTAVES